MYAGVAAGDTDSFAEGYRLAHSVALEGPCVESLSTVVRAITHALSNLLMPAREYPDLIRSFLPDQSPALTLIENLDMTTDRLLQMNEKMIRLCHGTESSPVRVQVDDLIPQVLHDLVDQDWFLTVDVRTDAPRACIWGPFDALYHLVRDLCKNAMTAAGADGKLVIGVHRYGVESADPLARLGVAPGVYLGLRFTDNGPGVAPALRETLFDPFVSVTQGEGHGLGLSTVYRTMCAVGGGIVYRAGGAGGDFLCLFPEKDA
jgi:signal transduction histidine kinase